MISKFQDMKEQHDVVLSQKRLCLQDIEKLTCSISDELKPHLQVTLQKLKVPEELTINSENQYIKKIASMTGVSERTLRVIKNEGQNNQGIWRTPGKQRAARATKVKIDNFDQWRIGQNCQLFEIQ
ncbi:unnamed protein product [Arctia plantaginis]|uniref:Uncharacterized protein n=1 Tax=Arctia plantaginis TaxID=874455 RepID=A0A8S1AA20_ARCPL|nr:unnamed protein product [Arctia plantaginis]